MKALKALQSFVNDVESGNRRLDIVQISDLCAVPGINLTELANELERAIRSNRNLSELLVYA